MMPHKGVISLMRCKNINKKENIEGGKHVKKAT